MVYNHICFFNSTQGAFALDVGIRALDFYDDFFKVD